MHNDGETVTNDATSTQCADRRPDLIGDAFAIIGDAFAIIGDAFAIIADAYSVIIPPTTPRSEIPEKKDFRKIFKKKLDFAANLC